MADWRADIIGYTWTSVVPPGQTVRFSLQPEQVGYDTVSPAYLCVANGKFDSLVDIYIDNRQITTGYYSNAAYRLVNNLTADVKNNHQTEGLPITIIDHKHAAAFLERYVSFPAPEQKEPPFVSSDEWCLLYPMRNDINEVFGTGSLLGGANTAVGVGPSFIDSTQLASYGVQAPSYIDKLLMLTQGGSGTTFTVPQLQLQTKRFLKMGFWFGFAWGNNTPSQNLTSPPFMSFISAFQTSNNNRMAMSIVGSRDNEPNTTLSNRWTTIRLSNPIENKLLPGAIPDLSVRQWPTLKWIEISMDSTAGTFELKIDDDVIRLIENEYFPPYDFGPLVLSVTNNPANSPSLFLSDIRVAQSTKPLDTWVSQPTEYKYLDL